jgi:hypothetical protein
VSYAMSREAAPSSCCCWITTRFLQITVLSAGVLLEPERLVRDAAQRAVLQDGLGVERRVCHQGGRDDDALSVKALD